MVKKYSVGTKIRYIGCHVDAGKIGKIVEISSGLPVVFLPEGRNNVTLPNGLVVTWLCGWDEVELLKPRNQQLLFDFMNKQKKKN